MQSVTYQHHSQRLAVPLKTQNHFKLQRRDSIQHRVILAAVREWESTLPGQAQERIAQLVAEEWAKADGRGIAVNKQNLFRYLKNEGGSEKYTAYVMQLSGSIIAAMPVQIARKHGLSNASTEAELVASAIKECSEAHQAKLIGAPLQKLEKEIREAAIALFNMLPADAAGPLLASLSAVAPQLF
ncbi:toxin YdaT family protein [Citrobacter youngae]|uniref:toxin YdaT family protein n=1 Tax=Citrobacter youngae TaxID=133448 RepID=UPI002B233281|nr:toxin YdaT family protein [Citrobacter youngae]MEB0863658.1 toxin YdaT family protein [Citrobacter youngae]